MTGLRSGLRFVVAVLALLLVISLSPAGTAGANQAADEEAQPDPLRVELDSITPATLTDDDQPVTITGTVTNQSDEPWTVIHLYAFRSAAPIPDPSTLAASAAIEPDAYVGDRVITPGTEATVDALDPGQSAPFSLTVPRSELQIPGPGVYWLGVHASGVSSRGRDEFADGRARTFIPLVATTPAKDRTSVEAAIVLPVRGLVSYDPDGRVANVAKWSRSLSDGGRLETILDAGDTRAVPLTWLVDPAVLAAVARLRAGNPPRSMAPDPNAVPPTDEPTPAPVESTDGAPAAPEPFATFSDPVPPVDPDVELSAEEQLLAAQATEWLARFSALTTGQNVLALPYGDLDVSAAAAQDPELYPRAVTRSGQVMLSLGVAASPALAPLDGRLSPAAIAAATPDSTILIGDASFAVPPDAPASMVRLLQHKVVVTSTGAAAGGPSPTPADDPLAIRQRLLSEAALRLDSPSPAPVVLMLPADWHPTDPGALLANLDVSWLAPVTVADVALRSAVSMRAAGLAYTEADEASELDEASFSAADELTARADLMAGLLTLPNLVRQQVADEALASLSVGNRLHSDRAADSVQAATDFISSQLASVTVDAPDAVTLSSESGNRFSVDFKNGLDQPVTVRLDVDSDGSLELEDQGPIQLSAGARFRTLPKVKATRPGIHQVELLVTDATGEPVGGSTSMQIRAAQVSGLIWLLIAGGALLLFGTIALRLFRRLRGHSQTSPSHVDD